MNLATKIERMKKLVSFIEKSGLKPEDFYDLDPRRFPIYGVMVCLKMIGWRFESTQRGYAGKLRGMTCERGLVKKVSAYLGLDSREFKKLFWDPELANPGKGNAVLPTLVVEALKGRIAVLEKKIS